MERKSVSVKLPSLGITYGDKLKDGLISLYPIRAFEEKLLMGMRGSGLDRINALLKSCIASDIDPLDLLVTDRLFILAYLKIISYGPNTKISVTCTKESCKSKFDKVVDLEKELDVKYLSEVFKEPFSVILPVSGEVVELRLIRGSDELRLSRLNENFKRSNNKLTVNPIYIYQLIAPIVSVNGEKLSDEELFSWCENLIGRDSQTLQQELLRWDSGISTEFSVTCANCGTEMMVELPTDTFFRPE